MTGSDMTARLRAARIDALQFVGRIRSGATGGATGSAYAAHASPALGGCDGTILMGRGVARACAQPQRAPHGIRVAAREDSPSTPDNGDIAPARQDDAEPSPPPLGSADFEFLDHLVKKALEPWTRNT